MKNDFGENYKKEMDAVRPSAQSVKSLYDLNEKPLRLRLKNKAFIAIACCFVLVLGICWQPIKNCIILGKNISTSVETTDQLYNTIFTMLQKNNAYNQKDGVAFNGLYKSETMPMEDASQNTSANGSADFSDTNVQVEGVSEADIIKTDGKYIYTASDKLSILGAENGKLTLMSSIKINGGACDIAGTVSEMMLFDDKLVLIKNIVSACNFAIEGSDSQARSSDTMLDYMYDYRLDTKLEIYDISNPENPTVINSISQSGGYVSSRMIGKYLYLITSKNISQMVKDEPVTYVPYSMQDGEISYIKPKNIFINSQSTNYYSLNYTVIGGYDIGNNGKATSMQSVLGYAADIYCSLDNLYITANVWNDEKNTQYNSTEIIKYSLTNGDIDFVAKTEIIGNTNNQFSIDEFEDNLRVVTTVNKWQYNNIGTDSSVSSAEDSMSVNLFVLDRNLKTIGKIENLSNNERVYSVRFDGDIGYVVTFRQVDPLFALDLSDPKNPAVLSALKIPGFSNYMQMYDKNLLFGIGKDADEKTGEVGFLKLSMFDISDKSDVAEKATLIIKDKYYSESLYNHKAILVSANKSIVAFLADDEYCIYGYENSEFVRKAAIKLNSYYYMARGLFIGNYFYIYTLSDMYAYSMDNFTLTDSVNIG